MKKYILILLLSLFFIPSVNAETYNSCFDKYKIADSVTFSGGTNYTSYMNVKLPLKYGDSTIYYLKFWNLDSTKSYQTGGTSKFYDSNDTYLNNSTYKNVRITEYFDQSYITYQSKDYLENVSYFYLAFYVYPTNGYYQPNNDIIVTLSDHELTTCPPVEEPEEPDEPIIPTDTTLDSFYSLYLTKLQDVSNYFFENKFLLGTLAIISLFIILEIILILFKKGGYR